MKVASCCMIVLTALLAAASCARPTAPSPQVPAPTAIPATPARPPTPTPQTAYWPTVDWRSASPEEQGMDSGTLGRMFDFVKDKKINLHSLLVIRSGYLVTEAYFYPYTPDRSHQLASMTKTVTGMLVGIAIDTRCIQNAGQTLISFYPDRTIANLDARKQSITLEHLLSMTSGLDCKDRSVTSAGSEAKLRQSKDWVQFMLDLPTAAAPGTQFQYCSGGPHLLSAVIQTATGMSTRALANARLFAPLGIAEVPDAQWLADPQGIPFGGAGLVMKPRDMAKLGYLYLKGGQWEGRQVVPADWVAASTTRHSTWTDEGIRDYGYLIWLYLEQGYYSAMGLGGQQIHVVPRLNLVVVFTAAVNSNDERLLASLLNDYIIPAAKSAEPLWPNPTDAAQLELRVQAAARPEPRVSHLPETARTLASKTFKLERNPFNWRTMVLRFPEGSEVGSISVDGAPEAQIGLDNVYRVGDEPALAPLALRGYWADDVTFVLDGIYLGDVAEYEFRFTFDGDEVTIAGQDRALGGPPIRMHGVSSTD